MSFRSHTAFRRLGYRSACQILSIAMPVMTSLLVADVSWGQEASSATPTFRSSEGRIAPRRLAANDRLRIDSGTSGRLGVVETRTETIETEVAPEGHFPTEREWDKIGGYYPRIEGDRAGGSASDPRTQAPSGLWPYPSADPGHFRLFPPAVDPFLGIFVPPGGGAHIEGGNPSVGGGASLGLDAPFLTRGFNPERATLKLGVAYIDVLAVSATVLYSDFDGDRKFPEGQEDGWLSAVSMDLRVVIPLTRSIYLSAAGSIYYLPGENRVGFLFGESNGLGFSAGVRLAYEKYVNGWWISVSDTVGFIDAFADLYEEVRVDEIDVAGRYRFGRAESIGRRSDGFFDEDRLVFSNRVAATAIGQVSAAWRLETDVARSDYWGSDSSENHHSRSEAGAVLQYAGQDWRFAPFAGVRTATTDDEYENFRHEAFAGVRGPLTQRMSLFARAGYAFSTGPGTGNADGLLYEAGIVHEVGPYTRQSLSAGSVIEDDIVGTTRRGRYARYAIEQRLGYHVSTSAFAQFADTENLDTGLAGDSFSTGLTLAANLSDFTRMAVTPFYDRFEPEGDGVRERWVVSTNITRRILPGLYGRFLYRFEDVDIDGGTGNFIEHVYMFTLTKTF